MLLLMVAGECSTAIPRSEWCFTRRRRLGLHWMEFFDINYVRHKHL